MGNICIKEVSIQEQEKPLYKPSGVEVSHYYDPLRESYQNLEDYYTKKHNDIISKAYLFSVI